MTDTPETDQKASPHIGFYSCATVPANFARALEQERDKAWDDLKITQQEWVRARRERAQALRERDEAKEALQISIESFKEMQAATWRTAGELRGMARKGLEKIKLNEEAKMSELPKWYNGREIPADIKEEVK